MSSTRWMDPRKSSFGLSFLALVTVLWMLPLIALAAPSDSPEKLLTQAWFIPSLTTNNDPECDQLLTDAKLEFATTESWTSARPFDFTRLKWIDPGSGDQIAQPVDADHRRWKFTGADGSAVFAYFAVQPGCGGACEAEYVVVADTPFDERPDIKPDSPQTDAAPSWFVYNAPDGGHYLVGVVDHRLEAYRISVPGQFHVSCSIALAPDKSVRSTDPDLQTVDASMTALRITIGDIVGNGGGNCGTLKTGARELVAAREALDEALYRPWAPPMPRGIGFTDYARVSEGIEQWSLTGPGEFATRSRYLHQLADATTALSRFYVKKFGWSETDSAEMAQQAFKAAIGLGFGFRRDDLFPMQNEAVLRKAILERKPVKEIEAIAFDFETAEGAEGEGLLPIAIGYPEALSYLLKRGLDPNKANPFGKTPLMYAAQFNQLESAKLLLKAGADPTARTFKPDDTCTYTIQTLEMTPLHYAVRYASAELVRLLLDNGASPLIKTRGLLHSDGLPIGWLRQYSGLTATGERNPNITGVEASALEVLLRLPVGAELLKRVNALVTRAEAESAADKFDASYLSISMAVNADPDNQRAVADFPLIALKAGRLPEAAAAADEGTRRLKSAADQASAWFNEARACELMDHQLVEYAGKVYCENDWIGMFVRSYELKASPARANKLRSLFPKEGTNACTVTGDDGSVSQYRIAKSFMSKEGKKGLIHEIYVLHSAKVTANPAMIGVASPNRYARESGSWAPHAVDRVVLEDDALTVIEAPFAPKAPMIDGHQCGFSPEIQ